MSTLKTLEESWIRQVNQAYLKPFVAWVTASVRKYRADVFYRTGWNVVALQIALALILLILVVFALDALYEQIILNIVSSFSNAIASGSLDSFDSVTLTDTLEYTKNRNIVLVGTAILMIASIFGYLIARLALAPTHNAVESQKRFVSNIAHELRTPLAVLSTNMEVALFDEQVDATTREMLTSNLEELERISDIINNLLSLNRLLRPEKITFEQVTLHPVLERVVTLLSPFAKKKGVSLQVSEDAHLTVRANKVALEQILTNLIKNAIQHTPKNGTVRIEKRHTGLGRVEIMVRDTGSGIAEKDLKHIFEPFYRGDGARNRIGGAGSGLGLAIVSELVKIHKGKIHIESIVDQGTSVTLTLPFTGKHVDATVVSRDFS